MIVISSILYEATTNDVIDWLNHFNRSFLRINPEDQIEQIQIEITSQNGESVTMEIKTNSCKRTINLETVKSYWYRRGSFEFHNMEQIKKERVIFDIHNYLDKEWIVISTYLSNRLTAKTKLGDIKDNQINKLEVLLKASRLGIEIPKTIVSTKPLIGSKDMITKCLYNGGFSIEESYYAGSFTQRTIAADQGSFFPSLFQEEIEKLYELRIFYLAGKFYSSAIFSQGNSKTEVDFRNYDKKKPNRVVPHKLPKEIELKLKDLMDELELETGSIDMIVTPHKKYVFLEVNPIGQFSQVSLPCNYYLEERIAEYLSHG
jgi:ATP-GRASP peptide maturase of grasp-with-spasm system